MRAVLDSNVLLSALISPHGASNVIYRAWRARRFELVTSLHQLEEIRRASRYPKLRAVLQPSRVGTMMRNLQRAVVLETLPAGFEAHGPNDAFLVAMAYAGQAQYLVTSDQRAAILQQGLGPRTGARALTPREFCQDVLRIS